MVVTAKRTRVIPSERDESAAQELEKRIPHCVRDDRAWAV